MRNRMYQWLWYKVVRPMTGVDDTKKGFERSAGRYKAAYKLSKLFGGWDAVFMGDSNAAVDDTYENMSKYKSLVFCMGAGGTTPGDITRFLLSPEGRWLVSIFRGFKDPAAIQFNTGGNCVMLNQMSTARNQLAMLHSMFPGSYNQTVAPVMYAMLDRLDTGTAGDRTDAEWRRDFDYLNRYIKELWTPRIIDMENLLRDTNTGEAYIWVLKDPVHIADLTVRFRQAILNAYI